jgi:hypothetical protein
LSHLRQRREQASRVLARHSHLAGTAAVMHVSVGELNPREPVSNAFELSVKPVLIVLALPRPLGIPSLSPLIPVQVSRRRSFAGRNAENCSDGFLCDSLLLIEPLVSIRSSILLIGLRLVWLTTASAISLHLRVPVATSRDSDVLTTHWTTSAAILDQLYSAELVEEVPAGQLPGRHHLVLADRAVLELADFAGQQPLAPSILRDSICITLSMGRLLTGWIRCNHELDQRKVTLKSLHELAELNVLRDVPPYFLEVLIELLSEEEVVEDAQVEAANENEETEVQ